MLWTKTLFPHSGIQKGISTHFVGALLFKVDHNYVRLQLPNDSYVEIRFVPPPVGIFPNLANLPIPREEAGGLQPSGKRAPGSGALPMQTEHHATKRTIFSFARFLPPNV